MTDTALQPNADVTNNWTKSAGSNGYACIDDAVTQPTDPTTSGDGENISSSTDTQVQECHVGTFTLGSDTMNSATLWVYAETGRKRGIDWDLRHGSTVLATGTRIPAQSSAQWHSVTYNGSITQAQIDDLRLKLTCVSTAGGGGADSVTVHAAYIVVNHSAGATTVEGGLNTESDSSLTGTVSLGALTVVGGLSSATNTALAGTAGLGPITVVGGLSTTTSTALTGSVVLGALTVTGGLAASTDTALAGTVTLGGVTISGGLAASTDTALAGTANQSQTTTGGVASSTDTALAGTVSLGALTITGGLSSATETALAGTANLGPISVEAGIASGTNTALAGSVSLGALTIPGGLTSATDSALAGSVSLGTLTVVGGLTGDTETALTATALQSAPQTVVGGVTTSTETALTATAVTVVEMGAGNMVGVQYPFLRTSIDTFDDEEALIAFFAEIA